MNCTELTFDRQQNNYNVFFLGAISWELIMFVVKCKLKNKVALLSLHLILRHTTFTTVASAIAYMVHVWYKNNYRTCLYYGTFRYIDFCKFSLYL